MKNLLFTLILILTSIISNAHADASNSDIITIDIPYIKNALYLKNTTLLKSLNDLKRSKLNLNNQRAKLLPLLNLSIMLPNSSNPNFLVNSVNFLFPFLIPSNWSEVNRASEGFNADQKSYYITKLNILSTALSMAYSYQSDLLMRKIYFEQNQTLLTLYKGLKKEYDILGDVTESDLSMSLAAYKDSSLKVLKIDEMISIEEAELKSMLQIPLDAKIVLNLPEELNSQYEKLSYQKIASIVQQYSPEAEQLNFVLKSSKNGRLSKFFGFISSAGLYGSSNNSSSGQAFENLKAGFSLSFGLESIFAIHLDNNSIDGIKIAQKELDENILKSVFNLMYSLKLSNDALIIANDALLARQNAYKSLEKEFNIGTLSLLDLLPNQTLVTESKIQSLKANLDLKLLKINLLRMMLEGEFSTVSECKPEVVKKDDSLFGRYRFGREKLMTLDELCRP
jgi:outer membrane protein TolC